MSPTVARACAAAGTPRGPAASSASSVPENIWTLIARHDPTGEEVTFTCRFLWMCQGYYRHDEGYTPTWPGRSPSHGTCRLERV